MKQWDSVMEGYLASGEARGLSEEGQRSNRRELERLGCWLKRRRPKPRLEEVSGQLLIQYLRSRTRFRAKATVAGVVSKLRCFGEYLVQEGVWPQNPMRWVRGPRLDPRGRLPRRIGGEHLRQLWEAAPQQRGSYSRQLSVAVLSLLYGTGLRRGELERLNVADWKRQEQLLAIDGRKTGCERAVPVSEPIARCLEAYLPLRHNLLERHGAIEEPALLINREGKRLSAESLGLLVHRLARKAKVPLVSLHQFRHTCASDLLENGASLVEVQNILGHKSVESTSRYLHVADPERVRAIGKHPLNEYLPALLKGEEGAL